MSAIKAHLLAAARNLRFLQVALQVVVGVLVVLAGTWLLGNLRDSLTNVNAPTDFGFLTQPTGFDIPENRGFDQRLPVWRMILIGIQNTVLAAAVGIVIATVLGIIVGVARLSTNWLVSKLAQFYVETLRNIPALVIIVFFSFALFQFGPLPIIEKAREFKLPGTDTSWLILSKIRIAIPSLIAHDGYILFWILAAIAVLIAVAVWFWRTQVFANTGQPHHRVLWSAGVLVTLTVLAFLALGTPFSWSWPAKSTENNFSLTGGFSIGTAYLAVTLALGLYTASHIAEIVRGSILAVPKGQTEASESVALSPFQKYRFVVLPQAMRIAVPAITNNYLNLTKNTSLGAAVGYAELASLTRTSYTSTSPAAQAILVMMLAYLVLSLIIALLANGVNYTLKLKER